MAVFPDLPGFEATVVVNGTVCKELSVPSDMNEDDPKLVTRYIEVTPGTKFEVHVSVRPEAIAVWNNDISAWIKVDGQVILKPLWRKTQGQREARVVKGLEIEMNQQWTRRDLVFSALNTDDSIGRKVDKALKKEVDRLGQITVEFFRVNTKNRVHDVSGFDWSDGAKSVPEKALKGKAISHKVSLTPSTTSIKPPKRYESDYIDAKDSPYATIRFLYRSRDDLKAEMIIPRLPTPVPLEERPIDELTLEETRELPRRQREQAVRVKQEQIRVKRERNESPGTVDEDDDDISVVEPKRRRVKAETIDLTDD